MSIEQPPSPQLEKNEDLLCSAEEFAVLQTIARRVGGDFGMQVKLGKPGGGSFFDPQAVTITLDPEHIVHNPDEAKFVAAHEGAHRAISPGPIKIGIPREEVRRLYRQIGFPSLHNFIEDPAVNDWVSQRFPGLEACVRNNYDHEFAQEHVVLSTAEIVKVAQKLGEWPLFARYCSELMRYWHQGRFSEGLHPLVQETLDKTLESALESMQSIPNPAGNNPQDILKTAQRRFQINTQEIWPEMQKLVEQDLHNESLHQMLQDLWESLPEELREMLEKALEEMEKDRAEKEKGQPSKGAGASNEGEEDQNSDSTGAGKPGESDTEKEKTNEPESKVSGSEEANQTPRPFPREYLSEETLEEIEELYDNQPQDKKKNYEEQAKEALEKLEDALSEATEGKLVEKTTENHKEDKERQKAQVKVEEVIQKEKQRQAEMKKKLEALLNERKTEYEKTYEEMADVIDHLYRRMQNFLIPEKFPRWRSGFSSGPRPNLRQIMQAEADPRLLESIWQRKDIPKRFDFRFKVLIDLSGSMQGEKIEQAFKGAVVLAEVLERLELPFSQEGFQNVLIPYKAFDKKLDFGIKKIFSTALREPYNCGRHNRASNNSDGYCVQEAYKDLLANQGKHNFLIVFSDGQPAPDYAHSQDLGGVIRKIREEGLVKLIGLGLGPGTDHVKNYYPTARANITMRVNEAQRERGEKDFAETLAELLEDMITNPENYEV